MGISQAQALEPELQIQIFETRLRHESIPYDVFDFRSGDAVYTTDNKVEIPDEIYIRLTSDANIARTVSVPFLKALSGSPTLGSTNNQVGQEEEQELKQFISHYNDLSHAVAAQEYGILARDKIPYELFEKITSQLAVFFKEYTGRMRREALLERFAENLREAPLNLTAQFNPNWFVAGRTNSAQPDFVSSSEAAWAETIANVIASAGTGQDAALTVRYLIRLEEFASAEKFIEPITIAGKESYVVLIPSPQAVWLKDPSQAGQLGNIWQEASGLSKEEFLYPGVLGRVGRLLIVEDNRFATLTIAGTQNLTMTAQYRGQGRGANSDPRDKSSTSKQIGMLLGKGALCEWKPEDWHYEYEYEQYDKIYGKGAFASCGIERVDYDEPTTTDQNDLSKQHDGSIMLSFAPPPAVF